MQCNKSGVAMVPLVEKIPAVYAGIFAASLAHVPKGQVLMGTSFTADDTVEHRYILPRTI